MSLWGSTLSFLSTGKEALITLNSTTAVNLVTGGGDATASWTAINQAGAGNQTVSKINDDATHPYDWINDHNDRNLYEWQFQGQTEYSTISALAQGTTSCTVTKPTVAAGDLLVIVAGSKYDNAVGVPSGFTELVATGGQSAGAGTNGVDSGTCRIQVFYKVSDGSEPANWSLTKTTETGTCIMARCLVFKLHTASTSSNTWSLEAYGSSDTDGGTAYAPSGSALNVQYGDYILAAVALNGDGVTRTVPASNVTGPNYLGTHSTEGTINGDDMSMHIASSWASTETTGTVTYTHTNSISSREGPLILVRIRSLSSWATAASSRTLSVTAPAGANEAFEFCRVRIRHAASQVLKAECYANLQAITEV